MFTILVGRIYAAYFLFQTPMPGLRHINSHTKILVSLICMYECTMTLSKVLMTLLLLECCSALYRQYDSALFSSSRQQSAVCSQVYDLYANRRRTAQQLVVIYLVLPIFAMQRRWFTHAPRKVDFFDIFIFNNH